MTVVFIVQHQTKASESSAKATKARNDYILSMVSANAAMRKFIVDDLPELINVGVVWLFLNSVCLLYRMIFALKS